MRKEKNKLMSKPSNVWFGLEMYLNKFTFSSLNGYII